MLEKTILPTDLGLVNSLLLTCIIQTMQHLSYSGHSQLRGQQRTVELEGTPYIMGFVDREPKCREVRFYRVNM